MQRRTQKKPTREAHAERDVVEAYDVRMQNEAIESELEQLEEIVKTFCAEHSRMMRDDFVERQSDKVQFVLNPIFTYPATKEKG